MVRFYVVRHGQSEFNRERRYSGQYNVALSERGRAQARCSSDYIINNLKIDMVISSDLDRAVDTVKPVADALGMPMDLYKELREVDVGRWQLVPYSELKTVDPEGYADFHSKPMSERVFGGAESYTDVKERVVRRLREVAEANDGKNILVGAHAGAVRVLCLECLGQSVDEMDDLPRIDNASITTVEYDSGVFTLIRAGYKKHLKSAGLLSE